MENRNDSFFAIRHSKAEYQLNEEIIKSKNPEEAPDAKKQWFYSDLTPEGKKLAEQKAEEFFDKLDPEIDALYFVSSDLVRAAETAKIYMDIAMQRGFEIIMPRDGNKRENKAEEIGEGYIRKISCLTLDHLKNMLREQIFKPEDYLAEKVKYPEQVSASTKEKWVAARKIIEADNKGSWGANYAAHSEAIAKIFPDVKSAEDVYKSKFLKMIKLIKFGQKKIKEKNPEKNIKVLAFSHENSFLYFLNKNFGESMENCESIEFKIPEQSEVNMKKISATAKGKTIEVNE
jgi:hypothetical protein